MTKITLFTNKYSRGVTVKWLLEELEIPYEEKFLEFGADMKTPEYLKINPMGKVPAIEHKGNIVTETAAICMYLSEVFSEKQLCPKNEEEKAKCYRWMFFAAGPLEESFVLDSLGINLNNEQKGQFGSGDHTALLNSLSSAISESKYILGDRFTVADIYVGNKIGFYLMMKPEFLDGRPEFKEYFDSLSSRPAFLKAMGR